MCFRGATVARREFPGQGETEGDDGEEEGVPQGATLSISSRVDQASPPGGGQTRYWMSKVEVMAPAPSQTVLLQAWE